MQHSKSFILSENVKEALGYLYKEIENLEREVNDLKDRLDDLESERGKQKKQTKNLENPKCIIKGNLDLNSGRKIYYFPGCSQYKFTIIEKDIGEDWFCTEKEAQEAGFVRSKTCP